LILTSTNNVNKKEGDVDSKQNEVLIKAIQIIENQRESEKETKQIDLYSGLSEKEKIDFENNKKKVVQNLVNHIKGINIIIGLDSEEEFVVNKIITNYQIHLKEKSDQPFAFKFQTTIDRRIYMNLVQRLAFEFFSKKELNNERENEKNNDFDTKFSHENQEQRDKLESKAENFIK